MMSTAIFTTRRKPLGDALVPILEFLVLFLFFILPLVACPLWGQVVQKKDLLPPDYSLWEEVHLDKPSVDAKWASYKMTYNSGPDTLFVQNIKTGKKQGFADVEKSLFTDDNSFVFNIGEDLNILDLQTLQIETISGVQKYQYQEETHQLIFLLDSPPDKGRLVIRSLKTGRDTKIKDVLQFALSPKGAMMALSTFLSGKNAVAILDLKKATDLKWILENSSEALMSFSWEKQGRGLVFMGQTSDQRINRLYYYNLASSSMVQLDPATEPGFPQGASLVYDPFYPLVISDDLQRVFFPIKNDLNTSGLAAKSAVEIWNGNDPFIYPENKSSGNFHKKPKLALWMPAQKKIHSITSDELPQLMLSGDLKYAVLSNPTDYQLQTKDVASRDFHVLDLGTFKEKIFLKKKPFEPWALNPSPKGRYFAYFKEANWWIYDFHTDTHTNITRSAGVKFSGKDQELVPESAYGSPGWSLDDKEILVYDQFDLWAVAPDGSSCKRLTHGRESGIKFRVAPKPDQYGRNYLYNGPLTDSFDLGQGLFLRAEGQDGKRGYFKWNAKSGENVITYGDYYADELKYSPGMKTIIYREQNFDRSPELVSTSGASDKKSFFSSNPQQKNYFWGTSKLIEYQNSKGKNLKGVLFYPAHYDPGKKYPMIVNIYENQSQELHIYENPDYENGAGINITLMTAQGYFVFLPDIFLEFENPGISAVDCVSAAVKEVVKKGIVNPDKIGLMGHSFGGFECSFIITQTNLFAAAIASGAITDLFSFYNSIGLRAGVPEKWRFYGEQWNMGRSPLEIPELYKANSPIVHAQKVTTPVLLWTGKNDRQVDPYQSYEFYLTLRELKKKSIMLVYPDQGHVLTDPDSQKDLTIRTLEWFNYYLKDDHSYLWITSGTK